MHISNTTLQKSIIVIKTTASFIYCQIKDECFILPMIPYYCFKISLLHNPSITKKLWNLWTITKGIAIRLTINAYWPLLPLKSFGWANKSHQSLCEETNMSMNHSDPLASIRKVKICLMPISLVDLYCWWRRSASLKKVPWRTTCKIRIA